MKIRKTVLVWFLMVAMCITGIAVSERTPCRAKAPDSIGVIYVYKGLKASAEKVCFYNNKTKKTTAIKGLSYDKKKNTLTMKNFNHPGWEIIGINMGDLKVVVKGNNSFASLQNSQATSKKYANTLSISGSGSLNLDSTDTASSPLGVSGIKAYIKIGGDISITASYSYKDAILVYRSDAANSFNDVFKITGDYSQGNPSVENDGTRNIYRWGVSTFSRTRSTTKVKKPGQMKITKMKKTTPNPNYPHGVQIIWKKLTKNTTGYQLQVSFTKSFKNPPLNKFIPTNYTKHNVGLDKGTRIYARIRAYNVVDGKRIYGKWSKVKTQKAK